MARSKEDETIPAYENEGEYFRINERQRPSKDSPLSAKEVSTQITKWRWGRLENVRQNRVTDKVFTDLRKVDFELLKYAGDNPLFSVSDLAILVPRSVTGGGDPELPHIL